MLILISGKPNVGKTYCMQYLQKKYKNIFIVDHYVNEIYQINQIGYDLIKQQFGKAYVNDIMVDKKRLGDLVLNNTNENKRLCDLIWPLIRNKLLALRDTKKNFIVEMAIYDIDINHFFDNLFDVTIVVKNNHVVNNDKSKFNQFYQGFNKAYDYTIVNDNTDQFIHEIVCIIEHYFNANK